MLQQGFSIKERKSINIFTVRLFLLGYSWGTQLHPHISWRTIGQNITYSDWKGKSFFFLIYPLFIISPCRWYYSIPSSPQFASLGNSIDTCLPSLFPHWLSVQCTLIWQLELKSYMCSTSVRKSFLYLLLYQIRRKKWFKFPQGPNCNHSTTEVVVVPF